MKDILVVCLQERDVRAIRAAGLDERFRIHYAGADLDEGDEFDPVQFLESATGSRPTASSARRIARPCSRR